MPSRPQITKPIERQKITSNHKASPEHRRERKERLAIRKEK